ncbi:uncharacterized protein [Narcine bancroftii]|uniref:uncharacterized protein isoform X2 n=1 Tax=Narcine bancroftii TaxID=1343680 RepID=UPI003831B857
MPGDAVKDAENVHQEFQPQQKSTDISPDVSCGSSQGIITPKNASSPQDSPTTDSSYLIADGSKWSTGIEQSELLIASPALDGAAQHLPVQCPADEGARPQPEGASCDTDTDISYPEASATTSSIQGAPSENEGQESKHKVDVAREKVDSFGLSTADGTQCFIADIGSGIPKMEGTEGNRHLLDDPLTSADSLVATTQASLEASAGSPLLGVSEVSSNSQTDTISREAPDGHTQLIDTKVDREVELSKLEVEEDQNLPNTQTDTSIQLPFTEKDTESAELDQSVVKTGNDAPNLAKDTLVNFAPSDSTENSPTPELQDISNDQPVVMDPLHVLSVQSRAENVKTEFSQTQDHITTIGHTDMPLCDLKSTKELLVYSSAVDQICATDPDLFFTAPSTPVKLANGSQKYFSYLKTGLHEEPVEALESEGSEGVCSPPTSPSGSYRTAEGGSWTSSGTPNTSLSCSPNLLTEVETMEVSACYVESLSAFAEELSEEQSDELLPIVNASYNIVDEEIWTSTEESTERCLTETQDDLVPLAFNNEHLETSEDNDGDVDSFEHEGEDVEDEDEEDTVVDDRQENITLKYQVISSKDPGLIEANNLYQQSDATNRNIDTESGGSPTITQNVTIKEKIRTITFDGKPEDALALHPISIPQEEDKPELKYKVKFNDGESSCESSVTGPVNEDNPKGMGGPKLNTNVPKVSWQTETNSVQTQLREESTKAVGLSDNLSCQESKDFSTELERTSVEEMGVNYGSSDMSDSTIYSARTYLLTTKGEKEHNVYRRHDNDCTNDAPLASAEELAEDCNDSFNEERRIKSENEPDTKFETSSYGPIDSPVNESVKEVSKTSVSSVYDHFLEAEDESERFIPSALCISGGQPSIQIVYPPEMADVESSCAFKSEVMLQPPFEAVGSALDNERMVPLSSLSFRGSIIFEVESIEITSLSTVTPTEQVNVQDDDIIPCGEANDGDVNEGDHAVDVNCDVGDEDEDSSVSFLYSLSENSITAGVDESFAFQDTTSESSASASLEGEDERVTVEHYDLISGANEAPTERPRDESTDSGSDSEMEMSSGTSSSDSEACGPYCTSSMSLWDMASALQPGNSYSFGKDEEEPGSCRKEPEEIVTDNKDESQSLTVAEVTKDQAPMCVKASPLQTHSLLIDSLSSPLPSVSDMSQEIRLAESTKTSLENLSETAVKVDENEMPSHDSDSEDLSFGSSAFGEMTHDPASSERQSPEIDPLPTFGQAQSDSCSEIPTMPQDIKKGSSTESNSTSLTSHLDKDLNKDELDSELASDLPEGMNKLDDYHPHAVRTLSGDDENKGPNSEMSLNVPVDLANDGDMPNISSSESNSENNNSVPTIQKPCEGSQYSIGKATNINVISEDLMSICKKIDNQSTCFDETEKPSLVSPFPSDSTILNIPESSPPGESQIIGIHGDDLRPKSPCPTLASSEESIVEEHDVSYNAKEYLEILPESRPVMGSENVIALGFRDMPLPHLGSTTESVIASGLIEEVPHSSPDTCQNEPTNGLNNLSDLTTTGKTVGATTRNPEENNLEEQPNETFNIAPTEIMNIVPGDISVNGESEYEEHQDFTSKPITTTLKSLPSSETEDYDITSEPELPEPIPSTKDIKSTDAFEIRNPIGGPSHSPELSAQQDMASLKLFQLLSTKMESSYSEPLLDKPDQEFEGQQVEDGSENKVSIIASHEHFDTGGKVDVDQSNLSDLELSSNSISRSDQFQCSVSLSQECLDSERFPDLLTTTAVNQSKVLSSSLEMGTHPITNSEECDGQVELPTVFLEDNGSQAEPPDILQDNDVDKVEDLVTIQEERKDQTELLDNLSDITEQVDITVSSLENAACTILNQVTEDIHDHTELPSGESESFSVESQTTEATFRDDGREVEPSITLSKDYTLKAEVQRTEFGYVEGQLEKNSTHSTDDSIKLEIGDGIKVDICQVEISHFPPEDVAAVCTAGHLDISDVASEDSSFQLKPIDGMREDTSEGVDAGNSGISGVITKCTDPTLDKLLGDSVGQLELSSSNPKDDTDRLGITERIFGDDGNGVEFTETLPDDFECESDVTNMTTGDSNEQVVTIYSRSIIDKTKDPCARIGGNSVEDILLEVHEQKDVDEPVKLNILPVEDVDLLEGKNILAVEEETPEKVGEAQIGDDTIQLEEKETLPIVEGEQVKSCCIPAEDSACTSNSNSSVLCQNNMLDGSEISDIARYSDTLLNISTETSEISGDSSSHIEKVSSRLQNDSSEVTNEDQIKVSEMLPDDKAMDTGPENDKDQTEVSSLLLDTTTYNLDTMDVTSNKDNSDTDEKFTDIALNGDLGIINMSQIVPHNEVEIPTNTSEEFELVDSSVRCSESTDNDDSKASNDGKLNDFETATGNNTSLEENLDKNLQDSAIEISYFSHPQEHGDSTLKVAEATTNDDQKFSLIDSQLKDVAYQLAVTNLASEHEDQEIAKATQISNADRLNLFESCDTKLSEMSKGQNVGELEDLYFEQKNISNQEEPPNRTPTEDDRQQEVCESELRPSCKLDVSVSAEEFDPSRSPLSESAAGSTEECLKCSQSLINDVAELNDQVTSEDHTDISQKTVISATRDSSEDQSENAGDMKGHILAIEQKTEMEANETALSPKLPEFTPETELDLYTDESNNVTSDSLRSEDVEICEHTILQSEPVCMPSSVSSVCQESEHIVQDYKTDKAALKREEELSMKVPTELQENKNDKDTPIGMSDSCQYHEPEGMSCAQGDADLKIDSHSSSDRSQAESDALTFTQNSEQLHCDKKDNSPSLETSQQDQNPFCSVGSDGEEKDDTYHHVSLKVIEESSQDKKLDTLHHSKHFSIIGDSLVEGPEFNASCKTPEKPLTCPHASLSNIPSAFSMTEFGIPSAPIHSIADHAYIDTTSPATSPELANGCFSAVTSSPSHKLALGQQDKENLSKHAAPSERPPGEDGSHKEFKSEAMDLEEKQADCGPLLLQEYRSQSSWHFGPETSLLELLSIKKITDPGYIS